MKYKILIILALSVYSLNAQEKIENRDKIQRKIEAFDQRETKKSNINAIISNAGQLGFDNQAKRGALVWPSFSETQYLYGSGFLFTCKKLVKDTLGLFYEYSFDLNTGSSNMVPGFIEDGDTLKLTDKEKYQTYSSIDYNPSTGIPKDISDSQNWPIWNKPGEERGFLGEYVKDNNKRNLDSGLVPSMRSDEDIISAYKDTDLRRYTETHGLPEITRAKGYPLRIQYQQRNYTYNSAGLNDALFTYYELENKSDEILKDARFTFISNPGISSIYFPFYGDENDRAIIKDVEGSPYFNKMFVCWSDSGRFEEGIELGYMGIAMIMTPKYGAGIHPEYSSKIIDIHPQSGIGNIGYIPFDYNIYNTKAIEELLDKEQASNESGGEKRLFISTKKFELAPGEKMQISAVFVFAKPKPGKKPNGSAEDMDGVIELAKSAADHYYRGLYTTAEEKVNEEEIPFELYPQPATTTLNIIIQNGIKSKYEILNLEGKIVKVGALNDSKSTIDISSLSQGAYWFRISDGKRAYVKKLIISCNGK